MSITIRQLFILFLMGFSAASCLNVNVDLPMEKRDGNVRPSVSPTRKTSVSVEPIISQPIEPFAGRWSVSLTTDGGYTNSGTGNFYTGATGKLTYQKPAVSGQLPPLCETKLTSQETAKLKSLVDDWRVPDEAGRNRLKLNTASDDIRFKMMVGSDERSYELEFYGMTIELLPAPNKSLLDALFNLREKACGQN